MGLDWCVEDKIIPGAEDKLKWANAQIEKVEKELELAWVLFRKAVDAPETSAAIFPNDDWRNFLETSDAKGLSRRREQWREERLKHVITPQQTLGAPRVGSSSEADEFVVHSYHSKSSGEDSERFVECFPTLESYIDEMQGRYVYELIPEENKDGLGAVTGIFAGGETFRGKMLNYVDWLKAYDGEIGWYSNKTPDELLAMGELLRDLHDARLEEGHEGQEEEESLQVVKQASTWCIFWGTKGHSMYAWY